MASADTRRDRSGAPTGLLEDAARTTRHLSSSAHHRAVPSSSARYTFSHLRHCSIRPGTPSPLADLPADLLAGFGGYGYDDTIHAGRAARYNSPSWLLPCPLPSQFGHQMFCLPRCSIGQPLGTHPEETGFTDGCMAGMLMHSERGNRHHQPGGLRIGFHPRRRSVRRILAAERRALSCYRHPPVASRLSIPPDLGGFV